MLRGRSHLEEETTFFVTTTIARFVPVFINEKYCDLLVRNIQFYQEKYRFDIFAYVIMPTHFHWVVGVDREKGLISDVMRDIKKYSAWDILEQLRKDGDTDRLQVSRRAARTRKDQRHRVWMERFDDKVIRDEEMMRSTIEYIHENPVKVGLVANPEDYRYSSARNYTRGDHSGLAVRTEW